MAKPARKPQLLSKDQRAAIERELSTYYGSVTLKADGHELRLRVEREKGLKWTVTVYVDGYLRGEWFKAESEIGAKFWRRSVTNVLSKKEQALYCKAFGKREAAERIKRATLVMHYPNFATARACLARLQRTCDGIEVVSVGYQPKAPLEVEGEPAHG